MQFHIGDMREGYTEVCQHVLVNGDKVAPRGIPTREILGATIVLHNTDDALPVGVNRRLSVEFAAVEAAQLIAGVSDVDLTTRINPNMEQFTNKLRWGESYFHGAYGPRVRRALELAVERIKADKDTRQAVVNIWQWQQDLTGTGINDTPCTLTLHFMVRENKLNLHVAMRSNDVWWGLAYDVFQFTQLLWTVAHVLAIAPGIYYHTANSLHAYERDEEGIMGLDPEPNRRLAYHPTGFFGRTITHAQTRAKLVVAGKVDRQDTPLQESERWYLEKLHG